MFTTLQCGRGEHSACMSYQCDCECHKGTMSMEPVQPKPVTVVDQLETLAELVESEFGSDNRHAVLARKLVAEARKAGVVGTAYTPPATADEVRLIHYYAQQLEQTRNALQAGIGGTVGLVRFSAAVESIAKEMRKATLPTDCPSVPVRSTSNDSKVYRYGAWVDGKFFGADSAEELNRLLPKSVVAIGPDTNADWSEKFEATMRENRAAADAQNSDYWRKRAELAEASISDDAVIFSYGGSRVTVAREHQRSFDATPILNKDKIKVGTKYTFVFDVPHSPELASDVTTIADSLTAAGLVVAEPGYEGLVQTAAVKIEGQASGSFITAIRIAGVEIPLTKELGDALEAAMKSGKGGDVKVRKPNR